jgi:hypothetical protein
VSGGGQTGYAGESLNDPIVVQARDASGHGVANARITYAVTAGGGTVQDALVPTDAQGLAHTWWTLGAAVGTQSLAVKADFTSTTLTVSATAAPPPLIFVGDPSYYFFGLAQSIGIGQYTNAWVGPATYGVTSPVTVSLSHSSTTSTAIPATLTIPAGGAFAPFTIVGTSAGTDVIVASAPGYSSGTLGVTVDLGIGDFGVSTESGTVKAGDSTQGYVCTNGPTGALTYAAVPTTFSLTFNANIAITDETGATINSVTIPANGQCTYFRVRGITAGEGSVTIASPNYKTSVRSITVTP